MHFQRTVTISAIPNQCSADWYAFKAEFLMNGRHFRVAGAGLPCISDERYAFGALASHPLLSTSISAQWFPFLAPTIPPVGLARNLSDCVRLQTLSYALLIGDRKPANRLTKSPHMKTNGRRSCVCQRMLSIEATQTWDKADVDRGISEQAGPSLSISSTSHHAAASAPSSSSSSECAAVR